MKNLIIIGKGSDVSNYVKSQLETSYDKVNVISINSMSGWDFPENNYDVIDFNVVVSKKVKENYLLFSRMLDGKVNKYILISTLMHGKEKSLFLSSYRKFKLLQETWLKNLFSDVLDVVYSPDILDSSMWRSISDETGIYKISSLRHRQIILTGTSKQSLSNYIKGRLEGKSQELEKVYAYLICTNQDIISMSQKIKALLVFFLSKSMIFSEYSSRRKRKNVGKADSCEKSIKKITYYGGGFADL